MVNFGTSKFSYSFNILASVCLFSVPITILEACIVSLTAVPCAKNSGLLATVNLISSLLEEKYFSISSFVPIGTVDLITTTKSLDAYLIILSQTLYT